MLNKKTEYMVTLIINFFTGAGMGGLLGGYLVSMIGLSKTYFVVGLSGVIFGFLHLIIQKFMNHGKKTGRC